MIELLISYLVVVFTLMVHVFCYKKCINKPLNTKLYKIIATLILSIGIMLNNMYSSNLVKSLLCFGLIGITFQIWYKEKLYKTFYYAITISIISLFIEFNIISNVFAKIFNCLDSLNQSFLAKTGVTILMGILLFSCLFDS